MTGRYAWRFWLPAVFVLTNATAEPTSPPPPQTAPGSGAVDDVVMGILSYTRWPAQQQVLRLCVVGRSAYAAALLDGVTQVPGPAVQARRALPGDPALARDCDAVYIGALPPAERAGVVRRLIGHPVVSIIEHDSECAVGGMFCLDIQPARVGFQVNLDSVARSGVRIDPNVLQLSRRRPSP